MNTCKYNTVVELYSDFKKRVIVGLKDWVIGRAPAILGRAYALVGPAVDTPLFANALENYLNNPWFGA